QAGGVSVATPPRSTTRGNLHGEWGLLLVLQNQRAAEQRSFMLGFGYSAPGLLNNIEVIGVDPAKVDALILSHGLFDHYGGLQGFLKKYRSVLPADVKLYAGGEDNFCHRLAGPQNELADFGTLDRRELAAQSVATVLCETPTVIAGHAFTTGKNHRSGTERLLPNTKVGFPLRGGLGGNPNHYVPAETRADNVPH